MCKAKASGDFATENIKPYQIIYQFIWKSALVFTKVANFAINF